MHLNPEAHGRTIDELVIEIQFFKAIKGAKR